jgi:hypothetical protein
MILSNPSHTLDAYSKELKERFEITVNKSQMSVILKKMNITRKKVLSFLEIANCSLLLKHPREIQFSVVLGFKNLEHGRQSN